MKVIIHSITASSEDPRNFTVATNLDGTEHEFELVVHEGPIQLVTGDQNYDWNVLNDPMKMGYMCTLVRDAYRGKALDYPIVLDDDWHRPVHKSANSR